MSRCSSLACFLVLASLWPRAVEGANRSAPWTVVESANFRLFSRAGLPSGRALTEEFEKLRRRLFAFWAENENPESWTPKCDIVLHDNDASYLAEVGSQAGSTVASSILNDDGKVITARRIDVLSTKADWRSAALPHELTHVVIADHFIGKPLPRWADEGMAILADPIDKRNRHWNDLQTARHRRQEFRVVELMELRDYPAAHQWGTFYGQSASLVRFLVDRESPSKFLEFVKCCDQRGTTRALQSVYQIESPVACETAWKRSLTGKPQLVAKCICCPGCNCVATSRQAQSR